MNSISYLKPINKIFLTFLLATILIMSPLFLRIALAIAPNTTILTSPTAVSTDTTPAFTFDSDDLAATFECKLDSGIFVACSSPYTSTPLSLGTHTFTVRSINAGSEVDPSPALFTWDIVQFDGGDGSSGNPYQISTCDQLEAISADLSASYLLVGNIDCQGDFHAAIGEPGNEFTGEFDGGGHTLSRLELDGLMYVGLFGATSNADIHDLKMDTIISQTGSSYVGALVGKAFMTGMTNIRVSNTSVAGSGTYVGGLVGYMGGGALGTSSYVNSSVENPGSYTGGLVGYGVGPVYIHDSYATGSVHGASGVGENYVGGLVGATGAGPIGIQQNYAAMYFPYLTSTVGGLIGYVHDETSVVYNFSAADMRSGGGSSVGGLFGEVNGTPSLSGNYFDEYLAGLSVCAGTGSAVCDGVNFGNSEPNYFKDNASNQPMSNWSFGLGNPWHRTSSYPELYPLDDGDGDGATNQTETAGPNSGDANNDTLSDDQQANVNSSLDPVSGKYLVVQSSDCGELSSLQVDPEASSGQGSDPAYQYPAGLVTFVSKYCGVSSAIPINIYFYGDYSSATPVLRKYNPTTHQFTTISDVVFTNLEIGGQKVLKASYTVVDGGALDSDGVVNGRITDPVGLGFAAPVSAPNTGLAEKNSMASIFSVVLGGMLLGYVAREITIQRKSTNKKG